MDASAVLGFFLTWPLDWFAMLALFVLSTFDTLKSSASRSISLALALPLTGLLYSVMHKAYILAALAADFQSSAAQAVIFLALLCVVFVLTYRVVSPFSSHSPPFLYCALTGIATSLIVMTSILQVPQLQALFEISSWTQSIFGGVFAFWWLLAAYVALAVARS